MRIAVVGAGAMGSLYAGMLAGAGRDVWLVGRSPAHIEAIRSGGLRLHLPCSEAERRVAVRATTDPAAVGPVDVVLFLTKAHDLASAASAALPLFGASTWALPLCNGLGAAEALAVALPDAPLACGVSEVGGELVAPGCVTITGLASTRFGAISDRLGRPALDAFARELEAGGLHAEVVGDIQPVIWTKLAMAGTMSSLSALTRLRIGGIAGSPPGMALMAMMVGEIAAVACARGVTLDREAILARADGVFAAVPDHVPSMAADLRAGRRTENDALAGAVSNEGARLGVATPICDAIARMIALVEANPGASIW